MIRFYASGGGRDAVQATFEIDGDTYRDDLGVDWHRAVVAIDARVDVVGPRRGSRVKRGMERQESGGTAVTHRRWCHLTPVIIIQHPATKKSMINNAVIKCSLIIARRNK